MRPQKVSELDILIGLTQVFRSKGYVGASMKDLSAATGLKKASLYHRFPNGKKEMAEAVMIHISGWVEENVFKDLEDEETVVSDRLKNGLNQIRKLYNNGKETCIFRALSLQASIDLFEEQIKNGMQQWIFAFKNIALALGFSEKKAQEKAVQTIIEIQGSLLVTKVMDDVNIFENTLQKIERSYLEV